MVNKRNSHRRVKRRSRKRRRKQEKQLGGFLPGLLGYSVGNAIRKRKGKKPLNFDPKKYIQGAIGNRIKIAKLLAGKKLPTPGNTGMSVPQFIKSGLFGVG